MCEKYNYRKYEKILWEFLDIFWMIFNEEFRITLRSRHREGGGEGVFFKIAVLQLHQKELKNSYEGAQFLIKLQAVGLPELNFFTGFVV